ncbi:MAG: polysaccharide deacetylase family protein [Candidatus Acidiferrales bacterium]
MSMDYANHPEGSPGVPVLLYHGIGRENTRSRADRFTVSVDQFGLQLRAVSELASTIKLDQLQCRVALGPGKEKVALTFDDGLESDFRVVFPLLQKHGIVAHFFVNTASVGLQGYMNWQQVRELHRAGMQIGSHGHRHICLTIASDTLVASELTRSREILENELQSSIRWFSAPYGLVTARVLRLARQSGYAGICTSRCWPASASGSTVPRVAVSRQTSIKEFRSLILRKRLIYWRRNLAAAAKYLPRHILLRVQPSVLDVTVSRQAL